MSFSASPEVAAVFSESWHRARPPPAGGLAILHTRHTGTQAISIILITVFSIYHFNNLSIDCQKIDKKMATSLRAHGEMCCLIQPSKPKRYPDHNHTQAGSCVVLFVLSEGFKASAVCVCVMGVDAH